MPKRMLIDSSHPEETRVVVLDGQKVEEFDFEAASKRPLKGNIYLAKVTRVEPSLQAAFVEYGGNRQGFLAFSEIHPDYYQIPVADRMALLAEAEAEARRRQEDDVESFEISSGPKPNLGATDDDGDQGVEEAEASSGEDAQAETGAAEGADLSHDDSGDGGDQEDVFTNHPDHDDEPRQDDVAGAASEGTEASETSAFDPRQVAADEISQGVVDEQTLASAAQDEENHEPHALTSTEPDVTESVPDMQTASEVTIEGEPARALQASKPPQRWMRRKHYKIQEVIKRRQIILVQVVKEERGNKGAALTTYLSLAGRYCVLMPNTPRGGGISRKITNAADRKRLKSAAQSLELPEGMGLIIRTAGENRTKIEIKRDYEYLLRLWDTIRELTLKSNAPACVYEEGDLIKRAIRDLYNKDVTDVIVEGDEGYRNAKDFMRMLMPSHAKNVRAYKEPVPLFQSHHIEAQLDAMFTPTVTLRSGGYIVINQTEALVSIDVNSGRATREHSIEETAHKTNLEAADEIGRQLRLRDLAGLIVIDFIDMEDARNDRDVERRLRDAVKNDRARVQLGRISQFGLLEMSRQRLRAGVIAGSTVPCPHCGGQGIVRSVESTALRVLRALEEEGQRLKASAIIVRVASDVAIYALNQKRKELARIESDYGMEISFEPKEGLLAGTFDIERTSLKSAEEREKYAVSVEAGFAPAQDSGSAGDDEIEVVEAEEEPAEAEEADVEAVENRDASARRPEEQRRAAPLQAEGGGRRRRRRRRGGRDRDGPRPAQDASPRWESAERAPQSPQFPAGATGNNAGIPEASAQAQQSTAGPAGEAGGRRRRRRRRRGRRGHGNGEHSPPAVPAALPGEGHDEGDLGYSRFGAADEIDTTPRDDKTSMTPNASSTPQWSFQSGESSAPAETHTREIEAPAGTSEQRSPARTSEHTPLESDQPTKKGWWQRTFR